MMNMKLLSVITPPYIYHISYLSAPYYINFVFQLHRHKISVLELILSKGFEELDLHLQPLAVQNIQMLVCAYLKAESDLPL